MKRAGGPRRKWPIYVEDCAATGVALGLKKEAVQRGVAGAGVPEGLVFTVSHRTQISAESEKWSCSV